MTVDEVKKVQRLLGAFFPTAKQMTNEDLWSAWKIALASYEYEEVRQRIVQYATENKFFPDLADLTGGLQEQEKPKSHAWIRKYIKGSEYQKEWDRRRGRC